MKRISYQRFTSEHEQKFKKGRLLSGIARPDDQRACGSCPG
jgi:hypothetical protein